MNKTTTLPSPMPEFLKPFEKYLKNLHMLTPSELEVMEFLGMGWSTKKVAQKSKRIRSIKTIESYRENIKQKLNIPSGSELIEMCVAVYVLRVNGFGIKIEETIISSATITKNYELPVIPLYKKQ